VRRYYEAREVFEFVADEDLKAVSPRASDTARAEEAEQSSGGCSASLVIPIAGKGFAGGFTFSPVSAPSPPMSLTAFSWRSASDSGDDGIDEELETADAASASEAEAAASGADTSEAAIDSASVLPGSGARPADETPPVKDTPDASDDCTHDGVASSPPASDSRPSTPDQLSSIDPAFDTLELRVIHRHNRTGFEEEKDFPIVMGAVVAGRYQITEYLGSAAFSKAVQAHDLQTGMLVCMKIIKNSKDFFDQSLDEIKLLKLLNSADPADEHNLLRLYDYFYHREHLFIVTELLRANLYEFQKYNRESGEAPYFTCSRLQRIAAQVLHALAFMHAQQVIHCDLKPENILIRSYSRCLVKVIDVGSSCFASDHLSSYVQSRSYRAPEVILGLPYDGRIDVWSLGCILAELYSGHVLFQNDSLATLLARCVGILGRMPARLLQARHARKYFTRAGELYERDDEGRAYLLRPKRGPLRSRLRGADAGFCEFVETLLALDPDARPTAAQAQQHPWLQQAYPPDE
jgi:serine/threonine protein kinase